VSPSSREREYAKRRYQDWQKKQQAKLEARRRQRNALVALGAIVSVVAVIAVVVFVTQRGGGSTTATPGATATSSVDPTATASATGTAPAADNPCPVPTVKAPAKPKSWSTPPPASDAGGKAWNVTLDTTCGTIVLALDGATAPLGVASTLFLSKNGFYDSTPCHRLVTSGIYVLQCGDPTGTGTGGPGYSYGPVENAPKGDLYPAGTVAMARRGEDGKSMGSQFFLVYKDSTIPSDQAGGYTVLGKIVTGLDIVEKIAAGGNAADGTAPARAISIVSTTVSPG
jgi:peptidyl-prolyl cis-trans isomerase B (cyclophilin B)